MDRKLFTIGLSSFCGAFAAVLTAIAAGGCGRGNDVVASVMDDGEGFSVEEMMRSRERGLGLFGMQERLALVRGQLVIDSMPGHGTRVNARVPLRPAVVLV